MGFLIKSMLLVLAWVIMQVSTHTDTELISKAFDQMFSLGLLVVFLVYMVYKEREAQKKVDTTYREKLQVFTKYEQLSMQCVDSNKELSTALKELTAVIHQYKSKE